MSKKQNLEGMFQKIPFDKAYQIAWQYNKTTRALKEQGAILNGKKALDRTYTNLMKEAAEYCLQFTLGELYALIGRLVQDEKQK